MKLDWKENYFEILSARTPYLPVRSHSATFHCFRERRKHLMEKSLNWNLHEEVHLAVEPELEDPPNAL